MEEFSIFHRNVLKKQLTEAERQEMLDEIAQKPYMMRCLQPDIVLDTRKLSESERGTLSAEISFALIKAYEDDLKGAFERVLLPVARHLDLSQVVCRIAQDGAHIYLRMLIRAGANINKAYDAQTPLNHAIINKHQMCVDELLSQQTPHSISRTLFDREDPVVSTPLYYALKNRDGALVARIWRLMDKAPTVMSQNEINELYSTLRQLDPSEAGQNSIMDDIGRYGFSESQEGLSGILVEGSELLRFMIENEDIKRYIREKLLREARHGSSESQEGLLDVLVEGSEILRFMNNQDECFKDFFRDTFLTKDSQPITEGERQEQLEKIAQKPHTMRLPPNKDLDTRELSESEKGILSTKISFTLITAYEDGLIGAFERALLPVVRHLDLSQVVCRVAQDGAHNYIKILIRAGVDVNKAYEAQTPLNYAIINKHQMCVDELLSQQSPLTINRDLHDPKDPVISTPLYYALKNRDGALAARIWRLSDRAPKVMSQDQINEFYSMFRQSGPSEASETSLTDEMLVRHGFSESQEGLSGILVEGSDLLKFMTENEDIKAYLCEKLSEESERGQSIFASVT